MDKVIVVPSPGNPWKSEAGVSFTDRCEMAKIAIQEYQNTVVDGGYNFQR